MGILKFWWKHKEISTFSIQNEKKGRSSRAAKKWTRAGKNPFFTQRVWQWNCNFNYTKTVKHWVIWTFLTFSNLTMHTCRNTYTLKIGEKTLNTRRRDLPRLNLNSYAFDSAKFIWQFLNAMMKISKCDDGNLEKWMTTYGIDIVKKKTLKKQIGTYRKKYTRAGK